MSLVRKFDFFQKISLDNITQPTLIGSFLSIIAIILMMFLLIKEVLDFLTPSIKKESLVLHDKDQSSKIDINFGINFPNTPCHIISVDQEDSVGNHRMDIRDTVLKNRMNKNGLLINEPLVGYISKEKFTDALEKEEGCYVNGFIPITKVKGDFHISFHNYADLYSFISVERRDLFDKFFMNHKLLYLNFGEINSNDPILKKFYFEEIRNNNEDSNNLISFNNPRNLPNYINEKKKQNYDYFVKLIPHIFIDKIGEKKEKIGYEYSMTSRARVFNPSSNEMPIVIINYDFSPITMKFILESKSFLHFLTQICAIIGGVFVMFKILNNSLLGIFDFEKKN